MVATGVWRDGSPLGGAAPERTCRVPSGQRLPIRATTVLPRLVGRFGAPILNP